MPKHLGRAVRNGTLCRFPAVSSRLLALGVALRHRFPSTARHELEVNLSLAFPGKKPSEITRLARKTLVTQLVEAAAQFRLQLLSRDQLRRQTCAMRVVGEQFLRAKDPAQPTILVTPHYGYFMHAALRVAIDNSNREVCFFYNPNERNPYAETSDELIDRVNARCTKIRNDRKGVVSMMRALRKGAILCIMPDQITPEGEIAYVPFFGRFFGVMHGTAFLAVKTKAQIIPTFCHHDDAGQLVLEYRPPLTTAPSLDEETQIYSLTVALFRVIEEQLRLAPEHWRYWEQFARRSLSAPSPPRATSELISQLNQVQQRFAHDPSVRELIQAWQQCL
jgi:KDO2-lipid IV(A) lauroyltransferase